MKILHAKKELVNINFVYYMMQNIDFKPGEHKRYWISQYSKIQIPLPPLSVQEEIVREIDGYQKIIDGAKQVIANWKPKIDIDPDWERVKLGEVAKVQGGFAFKGEDMGDSGDVQVIKIGNVKDHKFDFMSNPSFIKDSFYGSHADYQIKLGDMLISMTGTAGKKDYGNICIVDNEKKYLLNQRVGRISTDGHVSKYFIFYTLNQDNIKDLFYSNATGGVRQGNISNKQIEQIEISLPPLETQNQIVEKIEEEKRLVEANRKLVEIFEGRVKNVIQKIWG
jgi:type I restriction enzyme M protein